MFEPILREEKEFGYIKPASLFPEIVRVLFPLFHTQGASAEIPPEKSVISWALDWKEKASATNVVSIEAVFMLLNLFWLLYELGLTESVRGITVSKA